MAAAAKPVSGQAIESAWGIQVHDAVVTARGVVVSGGVATSGAGVKLPLDTVLGGDAAVVDLATNEFVAPVDGWYELGASILCSGYTGGSYRLLIYVAGVFANIGASAPGVTNIRANLYALVQLTAGQRVHVELNGGAGGSGTAAYQLERGTFVLRAAALGAS